MDNNLLDIPRLYTAIAEWAACMVYLLNMQKRFKGKSFCVYALGGLIFQIFFLTVTADVNIIFWIPCMMIAAALMIIFIYFGSEGKWKDAVYIGVQAFVFAEFAASFEWLLHSFFYKGKSQMVSLGIMLLIYGVLYGFYGWLFRHQKLVEGTLDVTFGELGAALLIAVSAFTVSNLSFISMETPFSTSYQGAIAVVRTLVDMGGTAIMYAYYLQRYQFRMKQELAVMQNVIQNHYLQYQMSKESIDFINYKYHDLKHQIALLRAEENPEKRMTFLDRMEEEIHYYEVQNKTGNKVLDSMLTGKSVICENFGISLNCVVDGKLLDFMDIMDICTIFGNALDNAIECEKEVPDKEKRLIHLAVFSQKDFLIMRFENYFEGKLKSSEGEIKTTKTHKSEFHGYGIKSIMHTVKKYGGAVRINVEDKWFKLTILIPFQQKEKYD
ncbi:GHKL domain-containing protein [Kineothrix sp. MB12-C1]|uniref:GHKL domain-containing protein n=1 Tax=Kineothrix sp. MB12-C1 TaxID=3070215 RepID=UPI0027D2E65C|nr:sensor histidine kinase [Kineothrix sp. MB12-C1]WMC94077.1 GHKL domain-containing protein [Kineothrix sp. MB12-C1]